MQTWLLDVATERKRFVNIWGSLAMHFKKNWEILIYQIEDGQTKVDVRMQKWLNCFKKKEQSSQNILLDLGGAMRDFRVVMD